jgi:hypothetical protein
MAFGMHIWYGLFGLGRSQKRDLLSCYFKGWGDSFRSKLASAGLCENVMHDLQSAIHFLKSIGSRSVNLSFQGLGDFFSLKASPSWTFEKNGLTSTC